ncbi:hypothetical protein KYY02_12695 [Streptomyces pimonensis]|uniref:Uncharacterized protein n=1 Tax=Streptomyces pimonensis TaxID=2860288 RepID=A0ABV4IXW0_9ACTN
MLLEPAYPGVTNASATLRLRLAPPQPAGITPAPGDSGAELAVATTAFTRWQQFGRRPHRPVPAQHHESLVALVRRAAPEW